MKQITSPTIKKSSSINLLDLLNISAISDGRGQYAKLFNTTYGKVEDGESGTITMWCYIFLECRHV